MTTYYGTTYTGTFADGTSPPATPNAALVQGKTRRIREVFAYAAQAAASLLYVGRLPQGAQFAGVRLTADTSSGSTTLAIGSSASAAKYKAAAAFTATDTPTMYGKASAMDDDPLAAAEDVYITLAAATAPASGILVCELFYTVAA